MESRLDCSVEGFPTVDTLCNPVPSWSGVLAGDTLKVRAPMQCILWHSKLWGYRRHCRWQKDYFYTWDGEARSHSCGCARSARQGGEDGACIRKTE